MLWDTERGCCLLDPTKLRKDDYYKWFERSNGKSTVEAVFRRLHKFLDSQNPSAKSDLVWVRLSRMMGRGSETPHKDIVYIEEVVAKTVHEDGKSFLIMCGLLFMIAISERSEKWLCNKNGTHEMAVDKFTGKTITWRGYWIAPDFVPPEEKGIGHSVEDLLSKFNKR